MTALGALGLSQRLLEADVPQPSARALRRPLRQQKYLPEARTLQICSATFIRPFSFRLTTRAYSRVGEASFRVKRNVHLVLYFRYLRFLPGGELVYRTCPHFPAAVAPTMANYERYVDRPANQREGVNLMKGRYRLDVRKGSASCASSFILPLRL